MATYTLSQSTATTVIAATSTTTAAPTGASDGYTSAADGGGIRTTLDYTGTVTSGTLRIYVKVGGAWFRGDSYAMTGTDEVVDWSVGEGAEVAFAVEAISGGGTVAVSAVGVQG